MNLQRGNFVFLDDVNPRQSFSIYAKCSYLEQALLSLEGTYM